jgi:hypothetical protein
MTFIEAIRTATAGWSHPDTSTSPTAFRARHRVERKLRCELTVQTIDRVHMTIIAEWRAADNIVHGADIMVSNDDLSVEAIRSIVRQLERDGARKRLVTALTEAARLMEAA